MSVQSKWQQLPTEAINPASLALDKLSPAQVVALEIPTGTSYVYEFDASMKIVAKEILS